VNLKCSGEEFVASASSTTTFIASSCRASSRHSVSFTTETLIPTSRFWSVTDPLTVFGARAQSESGTQPVTATFRRVAGWFSHVQHYNWETIASGVIGDMAYTV
jgi:hypothetical protein